MLAATITDTQGELKAESGIVKSDRSEKAINYYDGMKGNLNPNTRFFWGDGDQRNPIVIDQVINRPNKLTEIQELANLTTKLSKMDVNKKGMDEEMQYQSVDDFDYSLNDLRPTSVADQESRDAISEPPQPVKHERAVNYGIFFMNTQ